MNQSKIRQSNFELLRIVCMVYIIGIHIMTQTDAGLLRYDAGINYVFLVFFSYGGRLACNCYVMIGAWFLTESKFKAEKILNLWLEIFFYTTIITLLCLFCNVGNANIVTLVQAFFPVFGRPVWFPAEYICMLLLSPFMNKLLDTNIVACRKILIILGTLIIGCASLFPIEHTTPAFSELVWFCFLYFLVGYWKAKPRKFCSQGKKCWVLFGIIYMFLCVAYMILVNMGIEQLKQIANYYRNHYETLLAFASSVYLFYAMKNTHIPQSRLINGIGGATFSVYLIHQTPAFYPYLWNGIFHVNKYVETKFFFLYMIMVELVLFVGCMPIDRGRKWIFIHAIEGSKAYKKIAKVINQFMYME